MEIKDVFISYKAEEFESANWVKSTLERNGISCWMAPNCIAGGSSYAVEIPNAIRNAKVFVLILSSKVQESKWVPRELDQAINANKIILPFMIENCSLSDDFNFYLTNVQRYEAYKSKADAMEKMIMNIKSIIGDKPVTLSDKVTGVTPDAQFVTDDSNGQKSKKNSVRNFLVKISPYGRVDANHEKMKFPLAVSTVLAAISFLLYFIMYFLGASVSSGEISAFSSVVISVVSAMFVWYAGYFSGKLVKRISFMYKFFAFIIPLAFSVLMFMVVLFFGVLSIVY